MLMVTRSHVTVTACYKGFQGFFLLFAYTQTIVRLYSNNCAPVCKFKRIQKQSLFWNTLEENKITPEENKITPWENKITPKESRKREKKTNSEYFLKRKKDDFAFCCHEITCCHHSETPLNKAAPSDVWQHGSNFPKKIKISKWKL